jgi:hypothetical protein
MGAAYLSTPAITLPPPRRLSGCTGKVAFCSRADALKEARKGSRVGTLQAYECKHCGSWHLTSRGKIKPEKCACPKP